jgi:hypothetical protein
MFKVEPVNSCWGGGGGPRGRTQPPQQHRTAQSPAEAASNTASHGKAWIPPCVFLDSDRLTLTVMTSARPPPRRAAVQGYSGWGTGGLGAHQSKGQEAAVCSAVPGRCQQLQHRCRALGALALVG